MIAENETGACSLALLSTDRYGFRFLKDGLALTLVRGAYDPDPTPEIGAHSIRFALLPYPKALDLPAERISHSYLHPLTVLSGKRHGGSLPAAYSIFQVDGNATLTALKQAEESEKQYVFRFFDSTGSGGTVKIKPGFQIAKAYRADLLERPSGETCSISDDGMEAAFQMDPHSVCTIILERS